MTPVAILFLCFSIVVVWGGFVASVLFLSRRAEVDEYPTGGEDPSDEEVYDLPPIRDT